VPVLGEDVIGIIHGKVHYLDDEEREHTYTKKRCANYMCNSATTTSKLPCSCSKNSAEVQHKCNTHRVTTLNHPIPNWWLGGSALQNLNASLYLSITNTSSKHTDSNQTQCEVAYTSTRLSVSAAGGGARLAPVACATVWRLTCPH
jgi:hypothetical protein